MPNYIWGVFGALMVAVATGLYLMGYRWYDHGANGVGALFILLIMGAFLSNHKWGRRK
jgi:hypothetical protein